MARGIYHEPGHIPTPDEVMEWWSGIAGAVYQAPDNETAGGHDGDCWKRHPVCAMRRIHGDLSSQLERVLHTGSHHG